MNADELKTLAKIAKAQLLREQHRARPVMAAIAQLRRQRQHLEHLDRQSKPASQTPAIRAMGADVVWNAWLDRQRRDLNMQLARAMADQDAVLRDLRRAQSRSDAVKTLADQEVDANKRHIAKQQDAKLLEAVLLGQSKCAKSGHTS